MRLHQHNLDCMQSIEVSTIKRHCKIECVLIDLNIIIMRDEEQQHLVGKQTEFEK